MNCSKCGNPLTMVTVNFGTCPKRCDFQTKPVNTIQPAVRYGSAVLEIYVGGDGASDYYRVPFHLVDSDHVKMFNRLFPYASHASVEFYRSLLSEYRGARGEIDKRFLLRTGLPGLPTDRVVCGIFHYLHESFKTYRMTRGRLTSDSDVRDLWQASFQGTASMVAWVASKPEFKHWLEDS